MLSRKGSKLQIGLPLAVLLVLGCAHGDGAASHPQTATTEQGADVQPRARKAPPNTSPGHPPLAASPAELLEPAAREKVAKALSDKGFLASYSAHDGELTAALRKFQESQGLAATGFPDHETVRRLGIDPKEVDTSLENLDSGQGGSGHDAPPSDDSGKRRSVE
jgi:hypothetical protein